MSAGAAATRPHAGAGPRRAALGAGAALLVLCCLPYPLDALGASELAETVRFALLAMAVPALLVLGAPWGVLGDHRDALARLEASRRAPRGWRSFAALGVDVAVIVAWRAPVPVDALARHGPLRVAEAATLLVAGAALWLELVDSPPLSAPPSRPLRAALAALAMWSVWVVAYLEAMSPRAWYPALHHAAGSGLSATADRQAADAVLWAVAAACFMPVVFWNLFRWLRAEGRREDPTVARLLEERRATSPT